MVGLPSNIWNSKNLGRIKFTFEERENFNDVSPITQSYGLCFNDEGNLLIGRCSSVYDGDWLLPGGTVEKGENPVDTLHRELMEEMDVVADNVFLLGVQKVEFLDIDKEPEYQLRFAVKIKELNEQTPDPDNGLIWERKFIGPKEFLDYLPWGDVGEFISNKARLWFEENYSTS